MRLQKFSFRKNLRIILILAIVVSMTTFGAFYIREVTAPSSPNRTATGTGGSMVKGCRAVVTKDVSQAVDLDGFTGQNHLIVGTDDVVIQDAMNNILDTGRTTKESVCLIGSFTLTTNLLRIPSWTVLDARQANITIATNFISAGATGNTALIENADSDAGQGCYPCASHDIEVWGGIWNGNKANQINEANRAAISFRNAYNVYVFNPTIQHFKGLACVLFAGVAGQTNQNQMNNVLQDGICNDVSGTGQPESGGGFVGTCSDCHIFGFEAYDVQRGIELEGPAPVNFRNIVANSYVHDLKTTGSGSQCILVTSENEVQVVNNRCVKSATAGIQFSSANSSIVSGNQVTKAGQQNTNPGIVINLSVNDTVIGNQIYSNTCGGIQESGAGADFNQILDNAVWANGVGGCGVASQIVFVGTHTIVKNNQGFNPFGKVTNFIVGSSIGACGTGTTVVSATVYVVCSTDITWTCTGGTVTAIVEKDNLGNQIFSVANCAALPVTGVYTPIGYSITFTHTGAPTVSVFAD